MLSPQLPFKVAVETNQSGAVWSAPGRPSVSNLCLLPTEGGFASLHEIIFLSFCALLFWPRQNAQGQLLFIVVKRKITLGGTWGPSGARDGT